MEGNLKNRLRMTVDAIFWESIEVKRALLESQMDAILEMAGLLSQAFREKHRLFLFGNGGSAADAQHLAAEFVNKYRLERPPLPAIALTVDTSILTSISNDFQFEEVFLRQLKALAYPGDIAIGISTSGRSPNVIKAVKWARENGLHAIGWSGAGRSEMDIYCDVVIHVPSEVTARIQECHITVGHTLCQLVEETLFGNNSGNTE